MRNVRLDICYDGTRYRGWQRLANNENTIQEKLEKAMDAIRARFGSAAISYGKAKNLDRDDSV